MKNKHAIYNTIGKTYSYTRKADQRIVSQLCRKLCLDDLDPHSNLIDIGAGSGNYTIAIANERKDIKITGLEPSEVMIAQSYDNCKKKNTCDGVDFTQAFASDIPFENETFDGLTCILALHHFENLTLCIKEMMRVVKKNAMVVILTADPRLRKEIWVDKYFSFLVDSAHEVYLPIQDLLEELQPYALGNIDVEPMMLPNDMEDLFFLSGWARPELYLQKSVRSGISHFAKAMQSSKKNKMVDDAIFKLKTDLDTGAWSDKFGKEIANMKNYDGGYRIVSFVKK